MTRSLGQAWAHSAGEHADRVALWVDGRTYTYRDLHRGAGAIANALAIDASPTCAVFADRHLWSYVGIIGVLLAGKAYVPLTSHHPVHRLADILHACEATSLVMSGDSLDTVRDLIVGTTRRLTVIVPDSDDLQDWCHEAPHRFVTRSAMCSALGRLNAETYDGAYLLFTSGSTGAPKGVLISHSNVLTYLYSMLARYQPTPEDRCTQLFDLSFDLSVHDLFFCWLAGAALYVPPVGTLLAGEFVRRHELTFWFSVPSTIAAMARLRLLRTDAFPSLRYSLFFGEPLPKRLAAAWAMAAPNSAVDNLYGPTEATIAITGFRLPPDTEALPEIIPIGGALPDHHAVVVADHGNVAPAGASGEIYLAGSQLARGYWRRDDLTAERFGPTAWDPTGWWYRTGDRGVSSKHGLCFLGRADRQVKISGHRVELQEVESVLRNVAGSDLVAAFAWPIDGDGLAHGIVAFIGGLEDSNILIRCRDRLPQYMVPARIIYLAEWPVIASGKTDYTGLRKFLEDGGG